MRVEVIGGGPGGMYAARLCKLRHPTWEVRVRERNDTGSTFGFGIGLGLRTLRRMKVADPESHQALVDIGYPLGTWCMRIGQREIRGGANQSIGLNRAAMLDVLATHAEDAGVEITWNFLADLDDVRDADIVIAADGAGSRIRSALAPELGVTVEQGDLAYIWCGADIELSSMRFEVVSIDGRTHVAHVMPYGPTSCTFQVDTLASNIRTGSSDEIDDDRDHGTDQQTLDRLSDAFQDLLQGTALRGNRSTWSTFRTVRCDRWSHDNVVLVGDAAHTAHYSVGSGTRMAMEDALALVNALDDDGDPAGFAAYEQQRRPSVERLQRRAARSQQWWSSFPRRAHLPMPQLMVNYQTRTGAFGANVLREADPELVAAATAALPSDAVTRPWADTAADTPAPTDADGPTGIPGRVVPESDTAPITVVPASDIGVSTPSPGRQEVFAHLSATDQAADPYTDLDTDTVHELVAAGADGIVLDATGDTDLLNVLDTAERVRLATGVPVAVRGATHDLDLFEAAVLAGRVDLVLITDTAEVPA